MRFGRIRIVDDLVPEERQRGALDQRRFDAMSETLSDGGLGFVVTMDGARPETFRDNLDGAKET